MDSQAVLDRYFIRTGYPKRGHVYVLTDWRESPSVARWLVGSNLRAVLARFASPLRTFGGRGGMLFVDVEQSPDDDIYRRGMPWLHYVGEMSITSWLNFVNARRHCETVGLGLRYVGARGGYVFGF